jgi:hypothetical protein
VDKLPVRPSGVATVSCVRWDVLFADLEAQLQSRQDADFDAEIADRVRAEWVAVTLADRVRACLGRTLTWRLADGDPIVGEVADVGVDWVLLRTAFSDVLLPLAGVSAVTGLTSSSAPALGSVARRITLSVVLRGLAEQGSAVQLRLVGGGVVSGMLERVAADHVDVATHPPGEPWLAGGLVETVPFTALVSLTTRA